MPWNCTGTGILVLTSTYDSPIYDQEGDLWINRSWVISSVKHGLTESLWTYDNFWCRISIQFALKAGFYTVGVGKMMHVEPHPPRGVWGYAPPGNLHAHSEVTSGSGGGGGGCQFNMQYVLPNCIRVFLFPLGTL